MSEIKVGKTYEICAGRAEEDYGMLHVVKIRPNKRKVYLAELDGMHASVLMRNGDHGYTVNVRPGKTEAPGRAGKTTLPAEVLKPVGPKAEPKAAS